MITADGGNVRVPIIAVVGASVRAAVGSLLRANQKTVAADLFADADLVRCCEVTRVESYPDGFAEWLAATECDGWIYTGALENYPELVDQLAAIRPLLGHSGDILHRVRDPLALQDAHLRAGLDFPETLAASSKKPDGPNWLGKTYRGSSGSGVGVDEGAMYFQQYVRGTSLSAVFDGEQLLGATRQLVGETWAGAAPFQYCGSIGPWGLPAKCKQELQHLGALLCDKFGLTSLYGVDLIHDAMSERLWTIEVNPRYTAAVEVVERAYGVDVFADEKVPREISSACGKVVLFAKAPVRVTEELQCAMMQARGGTTSDGDEVNSEPGVADIPHVGAEIGAGEPICTLLDSAATCDAVYVQLQQRVRDLERQLYH